MRISLFKKKKNELDFEDVFLDRFVEKQAEKGQGEELLNKKLELSLSENNFVLLLLLGVFIFLSFLCFGFWRQIFQKDYFRALAVNNKQIVLRFASQRGVVYDRNKQQLVFNETGFDLWDNENNELAKENLNHEEIVFHSTNPDERFSIVKKIQRRYDTTAGLCHLLGYIGRVSVADLTSNPSYGLSDFIGKDGLEKYYENILKEKKGEVVLERTAAGREVSREVIKEAESGDSIILALDLDLQKKAATIFEQLRKQNKVEKGVVIALDPNNGDVLAMLSFPYYDNNLFIGGIKQADWLSLSQDKKSPLLNRAISGLYPTGSAIKPFVAYGALREGIIKEETTLYCPKDLCLSNRYGGPADCFQDWTFHGWSNVKRAIAESVNPFFYIIAGGYTAPPKSDPLYDNRLPQNFKGLGALKLAEYLELFGFGLLTGVDLPGEATGRVPTPQWKANYFSNKESQAWYLGDTYNLSIGQGYLLATPLRLATAFLPIANSGVLYQPHFLKEVLSEDGQVLQSFEKVVVKDEFLDENDLAIIRDGMRQAVANPAGSAFSLSRLPVSAAAKTGTAQMFPAKDINNNWIVVFAPYENPQIVLLVLLEEIQGLQPLAQQTAFNILNWYFTR